MEAETVTVTKEYGIKAIWGDALGRSFTGVSNFFLENLHRIGPAGAGGLTPTEAMVVIQLLSFKWGKEPPRPSLRTIATRLGLSVRTVRDTVKRLEELNLLRREYSSQGGCSRYHFDGLFRRLEALMAEAITKLDDAEEVGKAAA
jgi:DNA-binding MarR family transcriptional regulator